MTTEDVMLTCDVLVIGTEGAGARAAIAAADEGLDVLCVSKSVVGKSGATLTADADVDVDSRACLEVFGLPGDKRDSEEAFFEDMIVEGDYTNDQRLVEVHVSEAAQRIKDLVDSGARIDRLTQAPGHRFPRGIWIPGTEISRVLTRECRKRPIRLIQNCMVTDFMTDGERVVGAAGVDRGTGQFTCIQAKSTVLCTGGAMRLYQHTTAPEELTGDGLAAAFRVGAALTDMEFPMFLPYVLICPPIMDGVDWTYNVSAYLEAFAFNRRGERYMAKWDPERLERTTRDVNSVAAMIEVLDGRGSPNGGTYLSLTHFPRNVLDFAMREWLPHSLADYKYGGFDMHQLGDLSEIAVETAPACHFWNGGVVIDEWCRTTVPGLWAAGEGTAGIHGANRLSGNALTQTQVWGVRAGVDAAKMARETSHGRLDPEQLGILKNKVFRFLGHKGGQPRDLRDRIRQLAQLYAGPVRTDSSTLNEALRQVEEMKVESEDLGTRSGDGAYNAEWIEDIQIENLLACLELVLRASEIREESRGAAFRRDFPETNDRDWVKNIVLRRQEGAVDAKVLPVAVTSLTPPSGIRPYGQKRHLAGSENGSV